MYIFKRLFASIFLIAILFFSTTNAISAWDVLVAEFNRQGFSSFGQMGGLMRGNVYRSDDMFNMYARLHNLKNRNEIHGFNIVRSNTGQLSSANFYQMQIPFYTLAEHSRRLWSLNNFLENQTSENETRLLFVNPPPVFLRGTAADFARGLPFYDLNPSQDVFLQNLHRLRVDFLDLRTTFAVGNLCSDRYTFQTDHSWTTEAAFMAFGDIVYRLNSGFGSDLDFDGFFRDAANYYFLVYEDSFLGSFGRRAGLAFSGADDFTLILPRFQTDFTFEYVSAGLTEIRQGPFEESLIFSEYLELTGDVRQSNIIATYLGGVRPWGRIVNNNASDAPTLLLIHDSFGPLVAPYLAKVFSEVRMIRATETTNPINIEEYLQINYFDFVIILVRSENLINGSAFNFFVNPLRGVQ